ncbi:MAG: class I SAM-dependent rRNA methyltransferase [Planctomycetota bacterium]
MDTPSENIVTVAESEAVRIVAGYPWVLRDRTVGGLAGRADGDVVAIRSSRGRFLGRGIIETASRTGVRIFTRNPDETVGMPLFTRLLSAARARRGHIERSGVTDALRIANGEGDGLPGVFLDRYGDFLLVTLETTALVPHKTALLGAAAAVFSPKGIYSRRGWKGPIEAPSSETGERAPELFTVLENGMKFLVSLGATDKTGLFLDQRGNRTLVREAARDKAVLNTFAHTGAFSVAAALGGARRVVSVDLSGPALGRARDNFRANGLDPAAHEFPKADVFKALRRWRSAKRRFDIIILDPPTFSTGPSGTFRTGKDFRQLTAEALALLPPGGILLASMNTRSLAADRFRDALRDAAREAKTPLADLKTLPPPEDFPVPRSLPEMQGLKAFLLVPGKPRTRFGAESRKSHHEGRGAAQ